MDERARQGRKFGPASGDYERGRPDWPAAAVELAAAGLGLAPTAVVVDVGAGTGKLTRLLADRFARVVAVEPLAPMRDRLAAAASGWSAAEPSESERSSKASDAVGITAKRAAGGTAGLPRVAVREGSAERLPVADQAAQAVFVADAFHWFDGPAALAEAARVLTPDGGIVLLWNLPAGPWQPPLPEPARQLVREALARGGEPGGALLARGQWREAFAGAPFGELQHEQVPHELGQDRDGVIANVMSISSIAGLPEPERAQLRARLRELLPPARYRQPLRSEVYWARLACWCDRCGRALAGGDHTACAAARELEPPRFCRHCRRRLVVQVLPDGWTARCVAHGRSGTGPGRTGSSHSGGQPRSAAGT